MLLTPLSVPSDLRLPVFSFKWHETIHYLTMYCQIILLFSLRTVLSVVSESRKILNDTICESKWLSKHRMFLGTTFLTIGEIKVFRLQISLIEKLERSSLSIIHPPTVQWVSNKRKPFKWVPPLIYLCTTDLSLYSLSRESYRYTYKLKTLEF